MPLRGFILHKFRKGLIDMGKWKAGSKPELSPGMLVCVLLVTVVCLLGGWLLLLPADKTSPEQEIQTELSGALLRLHIVANSDSEADQAVKLQIRDAITEAFGADFTAAADKDAACALAEHLLPEAEALANQVLLEQGFTEHASASLTFCYFPEKTYGEMTFPAGYYDALRITIGDAKGQNWWCVLYPPLCFTDVSTASMPQTSRELLQQNLSHRTYEHITSQEEKQETPVIRFRFLTFLNRLFS